MYEVAMRELASFALHALCSLCNIQLACIYTSKSWGRGGTRLHSFNELHCRTLPCMQDGTIISGNITQ